MRAMHSQTKVPQKRLQFDECDINHTALFFIDGCSNMRDEEETGPEENKETSWHCTYLVENIKLKGNVTTVKYY